jgi:predicted acylesterase/phospholipase RssA
VDTCFEKFTSFCEQAFTPREGHGIWGLEYAVTLRHGSKYATTPLHNALKLALGDEHLFGGVYDSHEHYKQKVAVTSTTGTAQQAVVLPNYNRQEQPRAPYLFEFAHKKKLGLRLWEAACATSAAPTYFKPFKHEMTKNIYLDGALYHNNPVEVASRERKLIWPDVADKHPDVMLSLGTGKNAVKIERELADELKEDQPEINYEWPKSPEIKIKLKKRAWKRLMPGKVVKAFDLLVGAILSLFFLSFFLTKSHLHC